jgi:hypothetical protein
VQSPVRRAAAVLGGVVMLPMFLVVFSGAPSCMGFGPAAIDVVRQCPTAVTALGESIGPSYLGLSCGNAETEDDDGQASWSFPIAGSHARGTLEVDGVEHGGRWRFHRIDLTTGGHTIDVIACAAGGTGEPVTVTHQSVEGTVSAVVGHSSVTNGASCTITIDPSDGADSCRVNVTCGGSTLYGGGTQGYGHCSGDATGAIAMRDGNPTSVDGDPMLDLDVGRHEVVITDQDTQGTWVVTIATR